MPCTEYVSGTCIVENFSTKKIFSDIDHMQVYNSTNIHCKVYNSSDISPIQD